MDNTADKIEAFIDEQRGQLGSNLRELGGKVRSATDWKVQFERHTGLAVGLAVGGGILLAHLTSPRQGASYRNLREEHNDAPAPWKGEIAGHLNNVKSAIIDVAADGLTNFMDEIIPGFKHHLQKRRNS